MRHNVPCVICGQVKQFPIEEVEDAKDTYKCPDDQAHAKIRNGFGLTYEEVRLMKRHGVHGSPITERWR